MNKNPNNMIVGAVIAVVVFSGASFYAGMKYEQSKSPAGAFFYQNRSAARFGQGSTTGARSTGTRTGGPVTGSLLSKDATSLTIKLAGGGSQIAFYTASTSITKTSPSSVSELNVGDQMVVIGTQNPDGSLNAQSVQAGNETNRFRGGPQQDQSGASGAQ